MPAAKAFQHTVLAIPDASWGLGCLLLALAGDGKGVTQNANVGGVAAQQTAVVYLKDEGAHLAWANGARQRGDGKPSGQVAQIKVLAVGGGVLKAYAYRARGFLPRDGVYDVDGFG